MRFVLAIGSWALLILIAAVLFTDDRELILGAFLVLLVCWLAAVLLARTDGELVADEPEPETDWNFPRRIA